MPKTKYLPVSINIKNDTFTAPAFWGAGNILFNRFMGFAGKHFIFCPPLPSSALVPTFSTNSCGNSCYVG